MLKVTYFMPNPQPPPSGRGGEGDRTLPQHHEAHPMPILYLHTLMLTYTPYLRTYLTAPLVRPEHL